MFNWQTIDTVLLDMDGTLLDLHFDNYFWFDHLPQRYAEANNLPEKEARFVLEAQIRRYEGTLNWYCLDHWSELVQLDIPALKREIQHKIQVRPHTEQFLRSLRRMGKKLVLVTNSHPKGLQLKLDVTAIDRWLDIVISSHEFKTPKEDPGFWHHLMGREKFDPNRTLFIDDNVKVLHSAQSFGIKHLVCITQPDSQRPPRQSGIFTDVRHFDEIMPTF